MKDRKIAELEQKVDKLQAIVNDKDRQLTEKDAEIMERDAKIVKLQQDYQQFEAMLVPALKSMYPLITPSCITNISKGVYYVHSTGGWMGAVCFFSNSQSSYWFILIFRHGILSPYSSNFVNYNFAFPCKCIYISAGRDLLKIV